MGKEETGKNIPEKDDHSKEMVTREDVNLKKERQFNGVEWVT